MNDSTVEKEDENEITTEEKTNTRVPVIDQILSILPYESESDNLRFMLRLLFRGFLVLLVFLFLAMVGWNTAVKNIRVIIPPDLRYGAMIQRDTYAPSAVFSTASYLFQHLNHWDTDGEKDYPAKINALSAMLTPSCRATLQRDAALKRARGELSGRTRVLTPLDNFTYSDSLVEVQSKSRWQLTLDMQMREYLGSELVKNSIYRFPLRVVRWEADGEVNPWGLALDCLASRETVLKTYSTASAEDH